ncbi:MFS transporter [Amylibacter sp.]|jgi:MFS family permease|nr:MFS transporter [Amylibacter sp.]MDB4080640.1 MFS transporter [Amylibacter sp.]MDB4221462.1 MFS transporter [Amylibacter sp.]MDB4251124.1 MFS transporter [Amylibacter sp.]MDB9786329.1 MFS transporter [Amylibacter sp.]|tara:strand:+ start:168 stop:1298 length:1131 start_codon:yes stop_codon:yes gene_type:complete
MDYNRTAKARLATRLAFFAAGFSMGCCAPFFPFVKENVSADKSQFGVLLLCLGIGAIIAMPITGILSAKRGSKPMVLLGGLSMVVLLPILVVVNSPIILALILFLFGAALGTLDVAMNVHGVEVEQIEKRSLMSNFHAQFSIGGLVGAALMTIFLSFGMPLLLSSIIASSITFFAMILTIKRLLIVNSVKQSKFMFPKGVVLLLAIFAAIIFLVEGAVVDWGALLIIDLELTPIKSAGVGYILFSIAMVIARLLGDKIIDIIGEFKVLILGVITTIFGILTILLSTLPLFALCGFMLIGLGVANLVPIFFSAAGRQKIMPAEIAIASVTTTGYAGILLGPVLIGYVAEVTTLSIAFSLLIPLVALTLISSKKITIN